MTQDPSLYVLHSLSVAKEVGSCPFNWYYRVYTDALHKLVFSEFIGKVDSGIFNYNGSLYTCAGELLVYLGEK